MSRLLQSYAIRSTTGLRIVRVPESDAHLQAVAGETITLATAKDHADLAADRAKVFANLAALRAEPEERDILLEAIKSKVTPAELTAAAATLKSRRNTTA